MANNPLITIQKFPQTKTLLTVLLHAKHNIHTEVSNRVFTFGKQLKVFFVCRKTLVSRITVSRITVVRQSSHA